MSHTRIQRVITTAEQKINQDAAIVMSELTKTSEALPELREKVADLKDDLSAEADVKVRLKRGEDVPAIDLVLARAEDEIAEYRLTTTEARIDALESRLPAPSTVLADRIAPAFKSVIPGVELITTVAPLKTWRSNVPEGTTAVILCVAPKVERDPFRQTFSGTVEAYYIRSGLMRPISVASLEAAHRNGKVTCSMSVSNNRVGDEGGWATLAGDTTGNQTDVNALVFDHLTVKVSGVLDGLPVIREPKANSGLPKTWVMNVLSGFTVPGSIATAGVSDRPKSDHEAFALAYGVGSTARSAHPKVTEEIEGNERTLTVRHKINLVNIEPMGFADQLQECGDGYVGGSYVGMGVLTSVSVEPSSSGSVLNGNNVVAVVTVFASAIE
ncbi:hypothetical protein [Nocardioides sp. 616]|uniref:hypothetical protein n=1 Tax=Nocardioides sp. 616 TaxID=2268090 RepID=UPI000CE54A1D|nr:hypothetical protein [Nocardioides sp. 616]